MAKLFPFHENSLSLCSQALKEGHLVAFPTETVYGLGANALDPQAVEKIFAAKKRPKSDPLIVHVACVEDAAPLVSMNAFQSQCFHLLAEKFWPGPLTLIVNSSDKVPSIVTAGSSYIGIRIPNHVHALQLLKECGLPLAAPSANLFGHVSPTSALHVMNDLGDFPDLCVLDSSIPCQIGIESTIVKIVNEKEIYLLRPGAISSIEIEKELSKQGLSACVTHIKKNITHKNLEEIESSGQLLTHYSPDLESFIIKNMALSSPILARGFTADILHSSVLIDFNSRHKQFKNKVIEYFDLSPEGNFLEASFHLFSTLRNAEKTFGAKYILLPDFSHEKDEIALALFDRVYRAASGKII